MGGVLEANSRKFMRYVIVVACSYVPNMFDK